MKTRTKRELRHRGESKKKVVVPVFPARPKVFITAAAPPFQLPRVLVEFDRPNRDGNMTEVEQVGDAIAQLLMDKGYELGVKA
jgi:hypothetical protein